MTSFQGLSLVHVFCKMASKRWMPHGYVHPWISKAEWLQVYQDIASGGETNNRRACAQMKAWTSRSSTPLPFPVESTADILECNLLSGAISSSAVGNEHVLCLSYAMAVNRLVACSP